MKIKSLLLIDLIATTIMLIFSGLYLFTLLAITDFQITGVFIVNLSLCLTAILLLVASVFKDVFKKGKKK